MNEKFLLEWEEHFGKTEIKKKHDQSEDMNQTMHHQNILIKRKVDELEYGNWYLHDAYESVNVYSDQKKVELGHRDEKFKKMPHNVDELERFQLYEQVRSFSK